MRYIVGNNYGSYSFNPIAKTITLAGISDVLTTSNIITITNIKTNVIICDPAVVGKTCTISNNTILLTYDTSLMIHSDPLQIIVEIPINSSAETKIDVITFNFDLKQGQDLVIPMTYTMSDVPDSMLNNKIKMRLISSDSDATVIDNLDTSNKRIIVTGINKFSLLFPGTSTISYKIPTGITSLVHGVYLITPIKTLTICEGVVTLKKSHLNKADYYTSNN